MRVLLRRVNEAVHFRGGRAEFEWLAGRNQLTGNVLKVLQLAPAAVSTSRNLREVAVPEAIGGQRVSFRREAVVVDPRLLDLVPLAAFANFQHEAVFAFELRRVAQFPEAAHSAADR